MAQIRLSDGEWKLMKTLWEKQPRTLAELVSALDKDTGWSRATIFMMLKRRRWRCSDSRSADACRRSRRSRA